MPQVLSRLKIERVAAVDRGAGEGVRVLMMKRDGREPTDAEAETYLKREFSEAKRQELAASGAAMPGGEYPIENEGDLKNAIKAYGRGNDKPSIKNHIIKRARALGALDLLPAEWRSKASKLAPISKFLERAGVAKEAIDFDVAQANAEAGEYAQGMIDEFQEAICALRDAICSILADSATADKQGSIEESITQFQAHVLCVVPEGIENAMAAASLIAAGYVATPGGALEKGASMDEATKAAIAKAEAAKKDAEDKAEAAKKRFEAIVKMSGAHSAYMNSEDATMPDGGKEAFADMSAEERDAHVSKHPLAEGKKKRLEALPEDVRKALTMAETDRAQLAVLQKSADMVNFAKRATEIGLVEADADVLYKAHHGDTVAVTELETRLKAANEQLKKSALFKEFGSAQQVPSDVSKEVDTVVAELQKANPKLSKASAIAKMAEMREHQPLWKRYRAETDGAGKAA